MFASGPDKTRQNLIKPEALMRANILVLIWCLFGVYFGALVFIHGETP